MIKKIKLIKNIKLALIVFSAFFLMNSLNASVLTQEHHDDIWIDTLTVGEYRGFTDKYTDYTLDGKFIYCVEPNVKINTSNYYGEIGYVNSPYSNEINKKLQLIGFYGYGYPNHNTLRYKMATQALIWETIRPMQEFKYWTQANGQGTFIDIYSERNEIKRLVESHYTLPSFAKETRNATIGERVVFTDTTDILSRYEIDESENASSIIEGNNLIVTPNKVGEISVSLRMKTYSNTPTEFFIPDDGISQKMGRFNLDDPMYFRIWLNVSGASLEIVKKDSETKQNTPQGDATLEGAKYELLDEYGTHITYLITDKEGKAKTDNILSTNTIYTLKEVSASTGYLIDPKEYKVTIGNQLEVTFNVLEEVTKKEVEVIKVYANGNTGVLTPEPNITFDIYLKSSGEYYNSITTNKDGFASILLPYGTWIFKQKTTTPGYEKVEDFEIDIKDKNGKISKYLSNAPIKAKLKVVKIDSETKKVIKRSNIKFKIFNIDKNEYVCQTITYPIQAKICEYSTDENGEFITPYLLEAGNYKLEEVDQKIDGYLWNNESKEFTINDDSELINSPYGIIFETKFENSPVKGSVDITKYGEELIIKDDIFSYEEIELDGVVYELYAKEDIILADGTVVYKKDELIGEYETKDGFLEVNNLYLGKYYFLEKTTVKDHVLDTQKHDFELKYKDQYTSNVHLSFKYKNYLKKGNLEFIKTDLVNGEVIPNTIIEIYTENDDLIFTGKTDGDGKIVITDLKIGKYYIIEKEASTGYLITKEKVYFELKENGEIAKAEMTNKPVTGTLEFTKTDLSTGEALPNTLIEIYNDKDELIFRERTDENGKVIITDLKYGKYYIIEKEAPEGYTLNPEKMYFEIKENGEIVKATMTNEKEIDVPITLKNDYKELLISGLVLMTVATGMIIYGKIKKRKK